MLCGVNCDRAVLWSSIELKVCIAVKALTASFPLSKSEIHLGASPGWSDFVTAGAGRFKHPFSESGLSYGLQRKF